MTADPTATVRRFAYTLMIAIAVAVALARIFSAERLYEPHMYRDEKAPDLVRGPWPATRPEPTPMFGSNDRSRWLMVRALVDHGTFVIGHRNIIAHVDHDNESVMAALGPKPDFIAYEDTGLAFEDGWQSIDKMLNPVTHDYYSTKPPLLPVMVAGEYWLLKHLFGWDIVRERYQIVFVVLITINVLPLLVYLLLLACLVERFGTTDWGKLFVVAAACFGTLLTPFLNTFNNHTIGTFAALFALYTALAIRPGGGSWRNDALYVLAGLLAGFTAACELPALAFTGLLGLLLLTRSPWRAVVLYGLAAVLPLATELVINYVQLHEWEPAYSKVDTVWYQYEGSMWHFTPDKRGIDFARRNGLENIYEYAFHLLVGHHGFFSLTPVYFLGLGGMGLAMRQMLQKRWTLWKDRIAWAEIGALTLVLSCVIIGYYIYKTNNYGGVSNGPRWLMWLAPFWLLSMLPVVDRLGQSRWGRGLALVLLGFSVLSASYSAWNPWRHPWIYDWMNSRHLIPY